jgi:glutamyl-tRNA reductase
MPFIVIGLSHRSSPVTVRERFAFSEASIPQALEKLRHEAGAGEAVILSTCNRVEIYAATECPEREAAARLRQFLIDYHQWREPLRDEIYSHTESRGVEHLFKVACGLDSMVLGETEILGQLKKAYDLALRHKHTGRRLNKIFQKAFNVAKQIRTETNIQRGSVSVGSVAVELAEKIFSSLREHPVLVIGAGETSEKTARALLSRGAHSILVSNRSHERAAALALELGGRAILFEDWAGEFSRVDIVISSTAAPHHILTRPQLAALMKARKNRPLLLIDIAVPRDIDPEIKFLENVYLYNIDDLQEIAGDYLQQRKEEIARCEAVIRDKARALMLASPAGFMGDSSLAVGNSYCQVRRIGDSGVRPSSGAASTESCETVEFSGAYLRCHVAAPGDGRTPPLSCIPPSPQ